MNATALSWLAEAARVGVGVATIEQGGARVILIAAPSAPGPGDILSLEEATALAKLRTARPLKDAIRAGELPAFGKQRSRTLRRADLLLWIESRRSKPVAGADDADLERRMARLAGSRK